jgi:hypothetical protein
MIPTVRDRMTTEFVQLSLNQSLTSAIAALKDKPGLLGIILDEENNPVTIAALASLDGEKEKLPDQQLAILVSKLPPGIVVPTDMTLEAFVSSGAFTALDEGARGAIVTDQDKVIGILTEGAIDNYLFQEFESAIHTKGDDGLAGSIVTGLVVIYCEDFDHRNELKFYSRHKLPNCQVAQPYTHPLRRKA